MFSENGYNYHIKQDNTIPGCFYSSRNKIIASEDVKTTKKTPTNFSVASTLASVTFY